MDLVTKFRRKTAKNGVTLKWWISKYLPELSYTRVMHQINGFSPLSENITKAIKKYLGEE